jgi:predicted metal-dependent hydrolase
MFLPPHLVRYVLLHELAHLREMNHGRRYWALLEGYEPGYRTLDSELRTAWSLVPSWVQYSIRSSSTQEDDVPPPQTV